MKVREMVIGGLLTALALMIPLAFGGVLGITVPPFSATLASHLPLMLAMTISPLTALMVGLGSALGFLIKLGPIIGARAFMHVIVGLAGAFYYKRTRSLIGSLIFTLPIHAISEALIVLPFGFSLQKAGVVVGLGTALHHIADSFITVFVFKALNAVGFKQKIITE